MWVTVCLVLVLYFLSGRSMRLFRLTPLHLEHPIGYVLHEISPQALFVYAVKKSEPSYLVAQSLLLKLSRATA